VLKPRRGPIVEKGAPTQISLHFSCHRHHINTFGEIGHRVCGLPGLVLVDFCVVVSQTGFCVAYLIFIAKNILRYVPGGLLRRHHCVTFRSHTSDTVSRETAICSLAPPLVLMTWLRHLKMLAPFR